MSLVYVLATFAATILFYLVLDPFGSRKRRFRARSIDARSLTYGFFHPDALGGGGGERVLWQAVAAMQAEWPSCAIAIYIRKHSLGDEDVAAKIKVGSPWAPTGGSGS